MVGFSIAGLGFGSRFIYQDRNYGGDLNIHLDDDVNLDLDLDLTRTRIVNLHLDVDVDPILYGFVKGKDCGFAPGWIAGQMLKLPA